MEEKALDKKTKGTDPPVVEAVPVPVEEVGMDGEGDHRAVSSSSF